MTGAISTSAVAPINASVPVVRNRPVASISHHSPTITATRIRPDGWVAVTPEIASAATAMRLRSRVALIVRTAAIGAIDTPTAFGTDVVATSTYGSDGNSADTAAAIPATCADGVAANRCRAQQ